MWENETDMLSPVHLHTYQCHQLHSFLICGRAAAPAVAASTESCISLSSTKRSMALESRTVSGCQRSDVASSAFLEKARDC